MEYHFADPPPYDHQVAAVQKMIETKGETALLMEPGTGKTRSVLDYLSLLALAGQSPVKVLIVGPLSALDTWIEQAGMYVPGTDTPNPVAIHGEVLEGSIEERAARIASFANGRTPGDDEKVEERIRRTLPIHLRADAAIHLAVTNLETFSSKRAAKGKDGKPLATVTVLDRVIDAVRLWEPDVIAVDESHRIKGTSSNVSLSMARVRDAAPRRLILTGTVMPHSPMDVYGQWRFVAPTALAGRDGKPWNAQQFRDNYARMGGYMGREIIGWHNLDDLEDRMARNAIVVKKADALDLPPSSIVPVHVHLSPTERRAYQKMKDELAIKFSADDEGRAGYSVADNRLVQMLRMRQITSGRVPDADGNVRTVGNSKVRTAASLAYDLMASENRLVVFAHFVDEVDALAETIAKRIKDATVEVIKGSTKTAERHDIRKRFGNVEANPGKIILVCQMRTMSLAVNELVTASHAIYASMSERRDDYIQSMDRLTRIGQTKPVTFHVLVAPGTVDEILINNHDDRSALEAAMLAHVMDEGRH